MTKELKVRLITVGVIVNVLAIAALFWLVLDLRSQIDHTAANSQAGFDLIEMREQSRIERENAFR